MTLFSISAPFLGAPEGGVDTAPQASGCILEGPQRAQGEPGTAEDATRPPGAGITPEAVPKEMAARKGANQVER